MLKQNELAYVKYTKKDGSEVTNRAIIPTFIPNGTIKAVDVSELPIEEAKKLVEAMADYSAYYQLATSRLFNFEDWLAHTGSDIQNVKWRTFLQSNLEYLGDSSDLK